jgi:TRAP-type uncharacterized transport system substrate-binding protein
MAWVWGCLDGCTVAGNSRRTYLQAYDAASFHTARTGHETGCYWTRRGKIQRVKETVRKTIRCGIKRKGA